MPGPINKLAIAGPAAARPPGHEMRQPLAISAGLHVAILLLLIVGLPFFHQPPIITPTPIAITMVSPSDIARTTKVAPPAPEPPEKEEPEISQANQPPAVAPPPPPPPEPAEQTPAPPETLPPPKAPPPAPAIEPLKPVELQKQAIQRMPNLPALQKPMQVMKPKPLPPPPVEMPRKVTKQQDQDFDKLLNNLAPASPKADEVTKNKPVTGHPPPSAIAQVANTMTASELSLIAQRLRACWIVPAGGYDAENMVITISAQFNEDMTLKAATLIDTNDRYNSDSAYRAAADAALRALRNPACSPLPLPPGKYADWHIIQMNFDPKMMMSP